MSDDPFITGPSPTISVDGNTLGQPTKDGWEFESIIRPLSTPIPGLTFRPSTQEYLLRGVKDNEFWATAVGELDTDDLHNIELVVDIPMSCPSWWREPIKWFRWNPFRSIRCTYLFQNLRVLEYQEFPGGISMVVFIHAH